MSKRVFCSSYRVSEFKDSIGTVSETLEPSGRRCGSSHVQSGLKSAFEEAKKEGFREGHIDGMRQGAQDFEIGHSEALNDFRDALAQFVKNAQSGVDDWFIRTESALTTLAVEIARRAIGVELLSSRESVLMIAQQALAEVRHGTEVRVRVNPFDVSILESRRQEILSSVSSIRNLEIVPDLSIHAGCEIDTDGGMIDAKVESYLDRVAKEAA